jgi:hypothetical protein
MPGWSSGPPWFFIYKFGLAQKVLALKYTFIMQISTYCGEINCIGLQLMCTRTLPKGLGPFFLVWNTFEGSGWAFRGLPAPPWLKWGPWGPKYPPYTPQTN